MYNKSLMYSALNHEQGWFDGTYDSIVCPVCGFEYAHIGEIRKEEGHDHGDAGWKGRGDLVVIPIEGECGCLWDICFGFHKGNIAAFVRVVKECEPDEA